MKQIEIPTLRGELKQMILDALKRRYVSAGQDGIETGNHYQSIALDGERTNGFRSDREAFLDQIDFRGKRVLDLGSNLGELSRASRARGAALVDGFEYDPFFIELAQLVNAYDGTTRVSFFRRDITDASVYREHYDVVVAFSVYEYLQHVLASLADITDGLLVLETHRLERNLESTYLNPIGKHFPFHHILGRSDWGTNQASDGERAVIAFARTDEALRGNLTDIGLARHYAANRRPGTRADIRSVDVGRTRLYDKFFEKYAANSPPELLASVDATEVKVEELARNGDLARHDLAGWVYWLVYLKGALDWTRRGLDGTDNVYQQLLAEHWQNDPGRAADLGDTKRLTALVVRRFKDFELFRADADAPAKIQPLRIIVTNGPPTLAPTRSVKRIYEVGREVPVETTTVDGYHRLFLARLFGHARVPCDFVAEEDAVLERGL